MSEPIGEIPILISGDYSGLIADFQEAANLGAQGAAQIGASFNSAASRLMDFDEAEKLLTADGLEFDQTVKITTADLLKFADSSQNALASAHSLDSAIKGASSSAPELAKGLEQTGAAAQTVGPSIGSMVTSLAALAGVTLSIQGLKAAVEESLTAFASLQRATESLTALTGSAKLADDAISQLRTLAGDEALSFPSLLKADQQMAAFGISTKQSVSLLASAGDASRATGIAFDSVVSSIERIVESGNASSKALRGIGLESSDLASVMGVTSAEAAKLFKALDQSTQIDIVTAALAKFKGLASATSDDLTSSWTKISNAANEEFSRVGKELSDLGVSFTGFAKGAIGALGSVADFFITFGKGIASTAADIANALKNAAASFGITFEDYAAAAKKADQSNKDFDQSTGTLIISARQLFSGFQEYNDKLSGYAKELQNGSISGSEFTAKVQALEGQFKSLHPTIGTTTDATKTYTQAVADLKQKLADGEITQRQYDSSLKELEAQHGATAKAVKSHVLSLDDLVAKNTQLNSELKLAQSVYDQVTAKVEAGTAARNLQSEALKQLEKAHKALNDTELNSNTINASTEEKAQDLIDKTVAQFTATQQMTKDWGENDLAVQKSTAAQNTLLGSLGLTATQFQAMLPQINAAKEAGISLDGHIASLGQSFKTLGFSSSAVFQDIAEKAQAANKRIQASADDMIPALRSSWGDIRTAQEYAIQSANKYRDSLTPIADDFKALGIRSSQVLADMRDQTDRAFADIGNGMLDFSTRGNKAFDTLTTAGRGSAGDIYKAWEKLLELNREYIDSLTPVAEAFKQLHLTSSLELERMKDDAKRNFEIIRDSGTASPGDVQRAMKLAQDAADKWTESLYGTSTAVKGLADATTMLGTTITSMIAGPGSQWDAFFKNIGLIVDQNTQKLGTFAAQIQAMTNEANAAFASFDAADNARTSAQATGGTFIPGAHYGGGSVDPYSGDISRAGTSEIFTGTPFGPLGSRFNPLPTASASSPAAPISASGTPTASLPSSDQISAVNAQLQQMFAGMADAGNVSVTQLNALASTIGEFVTVDASGMHIAWQDAATTATSTATANQTLTTTATAATASIASFTQNTTNAVATITPLPPVLASFGAAMLQNTDAINAELKARQSMVDTLNQWIDKFNAQNASDLAAAYKQNPNQRFLVAAPLGHVANASPLGTSSQQVTGNVTNVTVNNPQVTSSTQLDAMVQQLRNLGV